METEGPVVDALLASDNPEEPMDLTDKQLAILEVKCEKAKGEDTDKPSDAKKGKYGLENLKNPKCMVFSTFTLASRNVPQLRMKISRLS